MSIEDHIAAWRREIMAAMPHQEDAVRELEAHLRDHIGSLLRLGVAPDEAFEQSVRRLGEVHGIAQEFRRIRSRWTPAAWVVSVVLGLLGLLVVTVLVLMGSHYVAGTMSLLLAAHVVVVTTGYLAVLAVGVMGFWALLRSWRETIPEAERTVLRRAIFRLTVANCIVVPAGVGLGMVWAAQNLGSMWSWQRPEIGALLVISATGLLLLVQLRRKFDDRARWLLAAMGGAVVIFGWFGVKAFTSTTPIAWISGVLIASHIAVALLGPVKPELRVTR